MTENLTNGVPITDTPCGGDNVQRILLECTDTYFSDWNTGIQRVVRNVAANSAKIGEEFGVECRPIVRLGDRYVALPWKPHISRQESLLTKLTARLKPAPDYWDQSAILRATRRIGVRLRKLFYPRTLIRKIVQFRQSFLGETVVPGPGDTLVLLDAWWNRNVWPTVAQARLNGAKIGIVMYDLLPVTNPEFFKSNVKDPFVSSLKIALEQGDYFVAISQAVRDSLRDYAQLHGPPRIRQVSFLSFQLGSTLDIASHQGEVRQRLLQVMQYNSAEQPYLTVGTIEPRKNQVLLLDAFEKVWERHENARLVIVGRVGWLCEDLIKRIQSHPRYKRNLFMFNDLSDLELDFCYGHSKAFIFPSHAEGFGLPVVEALQHGLPVMVSDIPIHREVGRDFCVYFDPHSSEQLANIVGGFEINGRSTDVREPEEYELPDWSASTRDFVQKCLAVCRHEAPQSAERQKAA